MSLLSPIRINHRNPTDAGLLVTQPQLLQTVVKQLCRDDYLVFAKVELGFDLGPHHRAWAKRLATGRDLSEMAPRDHGKQIVHSELVLSSRGWKTHGTLELGDKVFTPEGNQTRVVGLSEESQATMLVTFSNGEKLQCHPNHEWEVIDRRAAGSRNGVARPDKVRVLETKQLIREGLSLGGKEGRQRWWLPRTQALNFAPKELLVHPYVLGAWLGDGDKARGWIVQGKVDAVVLFAEMERHYDFEKEYTHPTTGVLQRTYPVLKTHLTSLGLLNNKHIPEIYQRSSIEQRLELLAGLIDTDGCVEQVTQKGRSYSTQRVRFVNTNERLIDDLIELCRGLGFKTTRSQQAPTLSSSGVQGQLPVHTVLITPTLDASTRLPRKKIEGLRSKDLPRISIEKIEPCEPAPGRCIQIEDPRGVYLVGKALIPTHNSHFLARGYPIWRAKYDPWTKDILLLGADQPSAVENLDKIKTLLETRPSLKALLPRSRKTPYSRTEIQLSNGVAIKAKGIGSPLRGRHPQLIVCDDILNERNAVTKDQRKEIRDFFFQVVFPLKDKGNDRQRILGHHSQLVVVGTAQDKEDLYHELIGNPGFIGEKLKAITDAEKGTALWPERYTIADLQKIKQTVGALSFAKEYMNEPLTDDTTIFPASLFDPMKDTSTSYVESYSGPNPVYLGADFSVPGTLDGDWTVVMVIEQQPDKMLRILNYWRDRPERIQDQLHKLELWCKLYQVNLGYLEDNLFQGIYAQHFKTKSNLPLQGHTVNATNKNSMDQGILSFRPLFENGRFILPYRTAIDQAKTDHLVTEFNGVIHKNGKIGNFTFHDDGIMALWHALCASRTNVFSVSWD